MLTLIMLASLSMPLKAMPQTGNACGPAGGHCVVLTWTDTANPSHCNSSSVPACTLSYNVYQGTTSGGETYGSPVSAGLSADTATIPVTLATSSQTFYWTIEAVISQGGLVVNSAPSAEVTATFPALPASPTGLAAVPH